MSQQKQTYATTRLGVGDMVVIRNGHPAVVSVDKENGAYTAHVIFSESLAPSLRAESEWSSLTSINNSDEVDVAIPSTATAVACRVTAIAGEVTPRVGARMEVNLASGVDLLGFNHRKRNNSGWPFPDFAIDPPGLGPPAPFTWYDMSDLSTLYQDEAGTNPVTANGQEVRHIANKGNGTSNPITSGVALGSTWVENWTNGLGSVLLDAGKAIGGDQVDVSTSNSGWTWFGILSSKVSNDFASIEQSISTSKTNITNVTARYVMSLRAALFTFSDYVIQVDEPVAIIGSLASDATARAICSASTQIKVGDGSTFQEIAQFDQIQLGAGLFGGVNHAEIRVWDALIDFELIKADITSKWGITWV